MRSVGALGEWFFFLCFLSSAGGEEWREKRERKNGETKSRMRIEGMMLTKRW
jgi:hypothetical protein